MKIREELWVAYTRIFIVELAYWVVSISLVFMNEYVLSTDVLTDDLTIFVTIFQILFSLTILITLGYITKHYLNLAPKNSSLNCHQSVRDDCELLENTDNPDDESIFHEVSLDSQPSNRSSDSIIQLCIVNIPHRINLSTCKLVFPLSILYIGMLLLNNFCLKYVGVAFYFVSRSLTTVFNVLFTYFIINEPVSKGALICCAFIVLGFLLGIDQENVIGSLSVMGVLFGISSSLFTSLFSIYTKKTLARLDKNIWVLVLYNNINAILICTPLLLVHGDVQALISDKVVSPIFWTLLSISGVMSFFISIVTNASIKYTSPLTHNISGTAKACLQTVIAVIYKHDHKSTLWWISNITILLASGAYSRIKQLEMESKTSSVEFRDPESNVITMHSKRPPRSRDSSSSGCSATSDKLTSQNIEDSCSVKLGLLKPMEAL